MTRQVQARPARVVLEPLKTGLGFNLPEGCQGRTLWLNHSGLSRRPGAAGSVLGRGGTGRHIVRVCPRNCVRRFRSCLALPR